MTAAVLAMNGADFESRYCADKLRGRPVEHDFLRTELADGSLLWLIPRCQGSAANPIPLPRLLISKNPSASPSLRAQVCVPCASLRRRDTFVRRPLVWRR
ncbi:hypothetical protein ACIBCH_20495 [Amycolatopsis thailandensis]|uniref:hypothetical protein n=1 Tax=Amycolatopsis thailandensis TaxID=589330 RepID=UPI0037AD21AC